MEYPIKKTRWFVALILADLAWNYWFNRLESDFWGVALPRSLFQTFVDGILAILAWRIMKLAIRPRPTNPQSGREKGR